MDHSDDDDSPISEIHSKTNPNCSTIQNDCSVHSAGFGLFQSPLKSQNTGRISKNNPYIHRIGFSPPPTSDFEFQESKYTAQAAAVFQPIPFTSVSQHIFVNSDDSCTIEDVCPKPEDGTDTLYLPQYCK